MCESSVAQERGRERVERMARERRGIALYRERGEEIEHIRGRLWAVPSCSGGGLYLVDLGAETCECPDFARRGDGFPCKHIYAAAIARAKSESCAGCSKRIRRRDLRCVGPENMTFFEGDGLCGPCAVSHGAA